MKRRRLAEAAFHSGGVIATARWQGHAEQLEKPSSSRQEIDGARYHITGGPGKLAEDERVADGSVIAKKRGNACGAKGPYCGAISRSKREAGTT